MMFRKQPENSPYPSNFIPKGARIYVGMDCSSDERVAIVKSFVLDGVMHIQEIEYFDTPTKKENIHE